MKIKINKKTLPFFMKRAEFGMLNTTGISRTEEWAHGGRVWKRFPCTYRDSKTRRHHFSEPPRLQLQLQVGDCALPPRVGPAALRGKAPSPAAGSLGSVWLAAHTPAGHCSDSDGPTAAVCRTHTHTQAQC